MAGVRKRLSDCSSQMSHEKEALLSSDDLALKNIQLAHEGMGPEKRDAVREDDLGWGLLNPDSVGRSQS